MGLTATTLKLSEEKRHLLKTLAAFEKKTMSEIIDEMIERYSEEHKATLEVLSRPEWVEAIKKGEEEIKKGQVVNWDKIKHEYLED